MIFRNEQTKEKLFIKKYLTRIISIFSFALIVNFCLFFFVLPMARPDLKDISWIFLVVFPLLAVYCAALTLIALKKQRKNFREYTFEITDDRIIINENNFPQEIKFTEIRHMRKIREDQFLISGKWFQRRCPSVYLENREEALSKLAEIKAALHCDGNNKY